MKLQIDLSRVLNKLPRMTCRVRRAQILSDLRSAGELQAVIERERAIIDRHGNVFSLLDFDVGNTTLQDVSIQHLARILRCRVRSTDEERHEAFFVRPLPAWKRAMDIGGALAGLFLLSPLLLLITILIKVVSPGPAFFTQLRVGHLGKPFKIWKFRTMKLDADTGVHQQLLSNLINSDQPVTKLDMNNDPRIIPFGNILRVLGLDELPQLFNVLRGDMSLVGPRPCLPYEPQQYLLWQIRRFDAIPGLTGLWQVSGKNRTTYKEMVCLDIIYARKISFWLDVKILLKTLPAIMVQFSDFLSVKRGRDHNDAKVI